MRFSKLIRNASEGELSRGPRLRFGLVFLAFGFAWPTTLEAAESPVSESHGREIAEDVFLHPRRDLVQLLNNSKRLLKQRRFSEAVRALGWILDCEEDYFVRPNDGGSAFHSLKAEARRLIGEMPHRGRDFYELEYGTKAGRRLRDATAAQDIAGIAEVSRKYFHTEAGSEATLLLGLCYLDRGRPLAAARILSRLGESWDGGARHEPTLSMAMAVCWARAGFPDKANECLESLRSRYPTGKITIGGRESTIFADGEAPLDWLQSRTGKLYVKASGKTNGDAASGIPLLNTLWRVPSSEYPLAEQLLLGRLRYCQDRNLSLLTAARPLTVGNMVLMRTLGTLLAVDFQTGKRVWMVPFDDLLDNLLNGARLNGANASPRADHRQSNNRIGALCNRYWRDEIYGSLSSDGRRVYSIEDLGSGTRSRGSRFIFQSGRRVENPNWSRGHNRLAARDIRSGKLMWQIGGPPREIDGGNGLDEEILPAAGSFFLGAPLCRSGRLYLLAESDGEILLSVVEAASGKVLWTQQLAMVEKPISQDWSRRYLAATPTHADGILVCPTGNGAVVAVEEATRSLLWGYPFPCDARRMNGRGFPRQLAAARIPGMGNASGSSWLHDRPVIVGDRVLLAAPLTDHLYCLGLFDGKLHWKSLRKGDLFIGCADRERVVLIGPRSVRALRISDGEPAWDKRSVPLGNNASTSGQGFLAGEYYYLPTGPEGVSAINIQNGKIELVSKSREGNVPGNLVLHKGKVLSQGLDGLKSYYELGSLRKRVDAILAKRPDDATALAWHGEILIDAGKREEAINVLRRSYQQQRGARNDRTEWLLREMLLEGLAEDFDKHRGNRAEIEQFCRDKNHLAQYLRIMAEGLEGSGEWDAALDGYLRLVDFPEGDELDVRLSDSHKVRLDRWLRVRLASFVNSAPAAARRRLRDEAKARLRAAIASNNLDTMRRFLDQFAHHPTAVEGRVNFVNRLLGEGNLIEAEMLLRQEARSKDRAVGGRATARLAEVLRKAGRPEDAAGCYRRLAFEFADVTCAGGMTGAGGLTGKEIVQRLPKDDVVRRWFQPDKSWPVGAVEVTNTLLKNKPRTRRYMVDLNFHGSRRPFFANRQLKFEQNKQIVTGMGAYGNPLWQCLLADVDPRTRFHINQDKGHVSARGHLLVLTADKQYVAIDCINPRQPRVLWQRQSQQTISALSNVGRADINAFWAGMQPAAAFDQTGRHPWQTGLLTDQYMCYQKFRGVVALDPLSGRELWTFSDLPKNCTLFGDEHLLFAVPFDSSEATVLRGADGQKLKTVTVPPRGERLATIGRLVLVWRTEGNRRIVEMVDPWQNRVLWGPYEFEANAKCSLVGNEALGVMEPGGRFTLLSLPEGKKKIQTQLQAEPRLQDIVLLEADGEYFLLTHSRPRRGGGQTPRSIRGMASRLIRQGRVYGFGRDGRLLWPDFPQGVEVKQQRLLLCQPSRLPVLTFACTIYNPNKRASFTSVLMIDKRSGRMLLERKFKQQSGNFELSGDPVGNTVDLHMRQGNLRLAFTGKPFPPIKKKLPVKLKPTGTLGGVLKAFEKVIPGIMPR